MADENKMKPMMVIPPDTISECDIQVLRDNGVCVVVSQDPKSFRFVDPIPVSSSRSQIEQAAIKLSRRLLSGDWPWNPPGISINRHDIAKLFVDLLVNGTPLDPKEQRFEIEYENARTDEVRRIAREDARSERAAAKAAKTKK